MIRYSLNHCILCYFFTFLFCSVLASSIRLLLLIHVITLFTRSIHVFTVEAISCADHIYMHDPVHSSDLEHQLVLVLVFSYTHC